MENKASYRERLIEIIDLSCKLFRKKIEEKSISIFNEASFQLQLGVIMKIVGQLYEFNVKDHFVINLESPKKIEPTIKSANGKARCDIEIALHYGDTCKAKALIELKYLRKDKNEAVTDNCFSVFMDLKNLEMYKKSEESSVICCEMVLTDNKSYTIPGKKIDIGDGVLPAKEIVYTANKMVTLEGKYNPFEWEHFADDKHHLLKVFF